MCSSVIREPLQPFYDPLFEMISYQVAKTVTDKSLSMSRKALWQ